MPEQPFDFRPFSMDQRFEGDQEDFHPVRGIGIAVMILLPLVCVIQLITNVQEWRALGLLVAERNGAAVLLDLSDAAATLTSAAVLSLVSLLVAGIVFLVWLWRARCNAERMAAPGSQRRGRGWTLGAWFCPVVNLWFPYQIVQDIYRASAPQRPVRTGVVGVWWAAWLVNAIIGDVVVRFTNSADVVEQIRTQATLTAVSLVFEVAAAAGIMVIIRRVSQWQELGGGNFAVPGAMGDHIM